MVSNTHAVGFIVEWRWSPQKLDICLWPHMMLLNDGFLSLRKMRHYLKHNLKICAATDIKKKKQTCFPLLLVKSIWVREVEMKENSGEVIL